MRTKKYEVMFKALNDFGEKHGQYVVASDENDRGLFVTARAKKSKKVRMIIIRNGKE